MVPDIFTRLIGYVSTPKEVEATPENLAKWKKRASGRVMHRDKCGLEELFGKHGILYKSSRQEEELRPLTPVPHMVLACQ